MLQRFNDFFRPPCGSGGGWLQGPSQAERTPWTVTNLTQRKFFFFFFYCWHSCNTPPCFIYCHASIPLSCNVQFCIFSLKVKIAACSRHFLFPHSRRWQSHAEKLSGKKSIFQLCWLRSLQSLSSLYALPGTYNSQWVIVYESDPLHLLSSLSWTTYLLASRWLMCHVASEISNPAMYSLFPFLKPWTWK